jgi:hypothetical protein
MHKRIIKHFFIGLLILITAANALPAQDSLMNKPDKSKWIDLRVGFIGDLKGTGMEFPALSLGMGGNYGIRTIVYSLRLNYNKEMILPEDAPPRTHIWDLGVLIGKNFTGGKNGFRRIILSGGIGMIWGTEYIGTGMYSNQENRISSLGFIAEFKMFWTYEFMGMGLGAIVNINPEIHYFGGVLYIPIGFF